MSLRYTLHRERPLYLHGYLVPFIILYAILGYSWLQIQSLPEEELHNGTVGPIDILIISLAVVGIINGICYLSIHWSVNARAWMTLNQVLRCVL